MTALAFRNVNNAAFDWRATWTKSAPSSPKRGAAATKPTNSPPPISRLLRARGFLALVVPAELGGHGLSRTETAAALRALAHYCPSTALALAMHTHVTAAAAWRWKHQKAPTDGLLKRIADRAHPAPDLRRIGLARKLRQGREGRGRLSHPRPQVVCERRAQRAAVHDRRDRRRSERGPTVLQFGVPMNAKGVSIVETWDTLGMRGTGSHDVVLDGVFVPDAAIAARRKPDVWHPLLHLVSMIAFPLVYSVYTGIAEAARDLAVAEASKRRDPGVELVGALDTELASTRIACDSPGGVQRNGVARSGDHQYGLHASIADCAQCVADGRSRDGRRRRRGLLPQGRARALVPRHPGRAVSPADGRRATAPRRAHRARASDRRLDFSPDFHRKRSAATLREQRGGAFVYSRARIVASAIR